MAKHRHIKNKPLGGIEPPAFPLQMECSNQLSYRGGLDCFACVPPRITVATRFELVRRNVNGFQDHPLNHSGKQPV